MTVEVGLLPGLFVFDQQETPKAANRGPWLKPASIKSAVKVGQRQGRKTFSQFP
ncbi:MULTISPECIES: hypothetical protein [unclassified Sinorhizobium]|uniref:hypothetical protein n=1 Tax=unclassified Sinorhizobium TaxID=2613772 RepID=UPI0035244338